MVNPAAAESKQGQITGDRHPVGSQLSTFGNNDRGWYRPVRSQCRSLDTVPDPGDGKDMVDKQSAPGRSRRVAVRLHEQRVGQAPVAARFGRADVILLLPRFDSHLIADGLKAGYWGFVLSDDGLQGLYNCLRSVQSGEKFFSTAVLEKLRRSGVAVHDETVMKSIAQLSTREKEILKLIATGLPGRTIADRLFMSYRTLANHKTNMTEKLKLLSARNLPRFAISVRDYL